MKMKLWHERPAPAYQNIVMRIGQWACGLMGLGCFGFAAYLWMSGKTDAAISLAVSACLCLVIGTLPIRITWK
jgi:hypothetical protein